MNSPEFTRPCHAVPEKWNGPLDVAALVVPNGRPASFPTARRWEPGREHGHLAAKNATEGATRAKKRRSARLARATFQRRMIAPASF